MEKLKPGLFTWTATHPAWTPDEGGPEGWEREAPSYAYDPGDSLVLFDPLVSAEDIAEIAAGRPVAIILSCRWHARSSAELSERLDAAGHATAARPEDLAVSALPYELGEDLPGDVEPQVGGYPDEAT